MNKIIELFAVLGIEWHFFQFALMMLLSALMGLVFFHFNLLRKDEKPLKTHQLK